MAEKDEKAFEDETEREKISFGFPSSFGKPSKKEQCLHRLMQPELNSAQTNPAVSAALKSMINEGARPAMDLSHSASRERVKKRKSDVRENVVNKLSEHTKEKKQDAIANSEFESNDGGRELYETGLEIDGTESVLPTRCFVNFQGHEKPVTALVVNPTGSCLISGGFDSEIQIWDFNGMTSNPRPFRKIVPAKRHGIRGISMSPSGSHFACCSGDPVCRVYSNDGKLVQETVRGDMYVRDLSETKGHTHGINACQWHPFDKEKFLTASADATVRVFDIKSKPYGVDQALAHVQIFKALDRRNLNIAGQCRVTTAQWAPSGAKFIVGGCSDGSLQLWRMRNGITKPDQVIREAHAISSEVSCIRVCRDDTRILSKATDHTLKLWDLRKFKTPVYVARDVQNDVTGQEICVDPNEKFVLSGSSSSGSIASLHIFKIENLESFETIPLASMAPKTERNQSFSIYSCIWPETLNQILIGCSDGTIRVFYDPCLSKKGALLFVNKPSASKKVTLQGFQTPIYTPDSFPFGFRETRWGDIRRIRQKETLAMRRKSVSASLPLKTASITETPPILETTLHEDPVQAIRAYAKKAEEEPILVTSSYRYTQPKPILNYETNETEEDEILGASANKCPRCGLKLCQCGYMKIAQIIRGPKARIAKH